MEHGREKLTLEERIARAARSQAASPEAAVRMVQQLAQTHTGLIFHGSADLELMYEQIGPYMDQMDNDLLHYSGFCYSINLALVNDTPPAGVDSRFLPAIGVQASNAVVLLGLMLLDHAKGRGRDKEVYHCTRMTLGQYLDALETVAFPEEEGAGLSFRSWREQFLWFYPTSTPLADALGDMLRLYIHGWKRLDSLDHVVHCMEELSSYLEREKAEDLEQYPDLVEHYFDLAMSYSWDATDPAGEETKAGAVRGQIFLSGREYSHQAVAQLIKQAPAPEFQALLEPFISERWLISGMSEVNRAVSCLFMMCVGPYLWMKKRPG